MYFKAVNRQVRRQVAGFTRLKLGW